MSCFWRSVFFVLRVKNDVSTFNNNNFTKILPTRCQQFLCCFSGRPEPKLRWWRGEMLLDSKDEAGEFPSLRRNTLIVRELSRADLQAVFTCQASNNNISQPVSASVAIEIHCEFCT